MIAIVTKDLLLGQMLQLEAERGGFSLVAQDEATLLLTDMPTEAPTAAVIGFGDASNFPQGLHVLPLPYDTDELQALLCRYHDANALHPIPGGALLCGRRIALSPAEEKLFRLLFEHRGRAVSADLLMRALGETEAQSNLLQALLYRLRKKLSVDGTSRIRSLRGRGYVLI